MECFCWGRLLFDLQEIDRRPDLPARQLDFDNDVHGYDRRQRSGVLLRGDRQQWLVQLDQLDRGAGHAGMRAAGPAHRRDGDTRRWRNYSGVDRLDRRHELSALAEHDWDRQLHLYRYADDDELSR